jgi:uncharacterized membrane protein YfhO
LDDNPWVYKIQQSEDGFMRIPDIPAGTGKVTLFYYSYIERLGLMLASASFIIGVILIAFLDRKAKG